jgi:hypothetical protein
MSDRAATAWAVCFVLVGALAFVVELDIWTPTADWLWPVLLMVLGVALLMAGGTGSSRGGDQQAD